MFDKFCHECKEVITRRGRGCTVVPDLDFHCCCVDHDLAYERGGTRSDRLRADKEFLKCMLERDDKYRPMAYVYYAGVRAFGWMFWRKK